MTSSSTSGDCTDLNQDVMQSFWTSQLAVGCSSTSLSGPDVDIINELEVPEILSLIPDFAGKDVLELGAGVGRFSEHFAKSAKSLKCVDFVKSFLDINQSKHAKDPHVSFLEADVRKINLELEKFDLVFSNGLLMYLTDDEIVVLLGKCLDSLRTGGYLFFHETCFQSKGDISSDPTIYRSPEVYNTLLRTVVNPTEDKKAFQIFEIDLSKSIQAYVKTKSRSNQVCWLMYKSRVEQAACHEFKTFQEFLDQKQYSRNGILRYERIFGTDYVSTGGVDTTKEFVKLLNLKPGDKVLDVGSGIGGGAFYMAKQHGALVTGIDLSSNMVSIALERAEKHNDPRVQFEICDATKRVYAPDSFDVIYSRDTILHITDKRALFASFLKWLKPGGRLLISDYCCVDGKWSTEFTEYVNQRGYILLSVNQYGKLLEDVGFKCVKAEDRTNQFVDVLKTELTRMDEIKEDFIKEFSVEDLEYLISGWKDKVRRCANGDQKWGLFYAEKSTN